MKNFHLLLAVVFVGTSPAWVLADEPAPGQERPPAASAPEKVAPDEPKYILMNNGRLLVGVVVPHKDGGWSIRQKLGMIHVETDDVEGIFTSLQAVYEHKRELLPPRDIQERTRLYQWCMTQGLLADAREQLQAILALSPEHDEAKALLGLLETRIARNSVRTDSGIMRTSATAESPKAANDTSADSDPLFMSRAMRQMAVKNSPVILDLPEALALKRAQEYNEFIHPTLQRFCAECHNERTPNGFGLVSAKGRAMRDLSIQRANLDATLKLVDPENLMQSPLLTNSLLPHQPNNKPIFSGPNNPYYRVIANWVSNLQHRGLGAVSKADPAALPTRFSPRPAEADSSNGDGDSTGGFGVEGRLVTNGENARLPIEANPDVTRSNRAPVMVEATDPPEVAAPGRVVPGSYNGPTPTAPKNAKFPVPLQAGGSPDDLLKRLQAEEADRDAREESFRKVKSDKQGQATDGTTDAPEAKPAKPATDKNAKPGKKPVKIDENLLEKFLQNSRSGG